VGGLAGIVSIMLRALAIRYGVAWRLQRCRRWRCTRLVDPQVWLAGDLKLIPMVGGIAAGALNATATFGVTVGIGEALAGLSAPWPDGPRQRGAPRLRGWPCGWAPACEDVTHGPPAG
jgi:hypothetical protein